MDRHIQTETAIQTNSLTYIQAETHRETHTARHTYIHTDRQT